MLTVILFFSFRCFTNNLVYCFLSILFSLYCVCASFRARAPSCCLEFAVPEKSFQLLQVSRFFQVLRRCFDRLFLRLFLRRPYFFPTFSYFCCWWYIDIFFFYYQGFRRKLWIWVWIVCFVQIKVGVCHTDTCILSI